MAKDTTAYRARIDAELGYRIAAELGYIHGLIDTIRTAPGKVDVTVFLDRIERVVTALEAVREHMAPWEICLGRSHPRRAWSPGSS